MNYIYIFFYTEPTNRNDESVKCEKTEVIPGENNVLSELDNNIVSKKREMAFIL